MTRTIAEGRAVVEAVERTGRIFRINTWFRFQDRFYGFGTDVRPIKKVVQNGLLGWPIKATVSATTGFDWKFYWSGLRPTPGPSPCRPNSTTISGSAPRPGSPITPIASTARSAATGTTTAAGWATWACTTSIPSSTSSTRTTRARSRSSADCPQQHPDACGTWRRIEMKYADGCIIVLDGEDRDKEAAVPRGPARARSTAASDSDIPHFEDAVAALPDPEPVVTDFVESVRTRRRFALNERNGHRSCTLVNLGKIAVQLGRPLRFDPEKERFDGDEEANRLVDQPMRAPWRLPE